MGNVRLVIGATFNDGSHINISRLTVARLKVHDWSCGCRIIYGLWYGSTWSERLIRLCI